MTRMTLREFRQLVRKLVREYVTNDSPYNARKDAHPDPGGATWDQGMDQGMPSVSMDESEEEHVDTRTGKRDPRWDDHADPTAKNWDTGLE